MSLLLLACQLERSEIVQEQVTAARDQIQEFQAHFVTISGPRFLSFDRLRPHEECRRGDELIVYDLVAEVRDASTRGEVFILFSHQWLGWSEPDPQRIHVKAMQQAVRAVCTDTDMTSMVRDSFRRVNVVSETDSEKASPAAARPAARPQLSWRASAPEYGTFES